MKKLCRDDACFIGNVSSWKWNALKKGILATDLIVEDALASDHFRVDIRKKWVGDPLLLTELSEYLLVVVGDGIEFDARRLEFWVCVAKHAELRPARRSPNRRSKKNDDCFAVGATLVEIDEIAVRIGQLEIWEPLANLRTG